MKGIKLSKTSWIILSAGVFIVVLAGLGLTRSQQMSEITKLDSERSQYEMNLGKIQTTQLSQQLENLKGKVDEAESQLKDAQAKLNQTVISVDVADEFFKIASYSSVNVTRLTTTVIAQSKIEGISVSTISISAVVEGLKKNIVDFIYNINNGYITGNIQTAIIDFDGHIDEENPESDEGSGEESSAEPREGEELEIGLATATVNMMIYSYEGK
jgi:hypothetical protein